MNIKKVSDLTGVSADTIRYYERIGLIPPVTRQSIGNPGFYGAGDWASGICPLLSKGWCQR